MFGIYGIEPTDDTVKLLKETGACGVVLLRRNIVDPTQVEDLIRKLQERVGHRLLIAVDHEGGFVTRFSRGVTAFPGNMALGKVGNSKHAYEVGQHMARELRAMGIHINLAPVLDMASAKFYPYLHVRSFGWLPKAASELGAQMIRGMQDHGLLATAKHFPGMGVETGNKALGFTKCGYTREDLEKNHLPPFREAVAADVALMMTSHVSYPELDTKPERPATFSDTIVREMLHKEVGFQGVTMTDDLSAPMIQQHGGVGEAAVQASIAGHDLLLVAHYPDFQREAYDAYRKALEDGRINPAHDQESRTRIVSLLARASGASRPQRPDPKKSAALAEAISHSAVRIHRDPPACIPIGPNHRTGMIVPRLGDIEYRYVLDDAVRDMPIFVQSWLSDVRNDVEVLEIPLDPSPDKIRDIVEWAKSFDVVVDLCFDAARISGQKQIIKSLKDVKRGVAVLIFHPWDEPLVPKNVAVVQTFGFRKPQVVAALDMIFKGR